MSAGDVLKTLDEMGRFVERRSRAGRPPKAPGQKKVSKGLRLSPGAWYCLQFLSEYEEASQAEVLEFLLCGAFEATVTNDPDSKLFAAYAALREAGSEDET